MSYIQMTGVVSTSSPPIGFGFPLVHVTTEIATRLVAMEIKSYELSARLAELEQHLHSSNAELKNEILLLHAKIQSGSAPPPYKLSVCQRIRFKLANLCS